MVGIEPPFLALATLGEPLAIAIEPAQDRQAPNFAGRPKAADHQAQHDPVVSPTDQLHGPAGNQGIVMHAGAVDGQTTFAAEGVVASQFDEADRRKGSNQDLGQDLPKEIEIPTGLTEEAMVTTEVPAVCRTTGQDQLGNETAARRKAPAGHERAKRLVAGLVENVAKLV